MTSGRSRKKRVSRSTDSSKDCSVSRFSRSPTCGPRTASPPDARQKAFLTRAPQASTGRGKGRAHRHRGGHEAACPAHDERAPQDHTRHRVVGARLDFPVVYQEQVGDAGQAPERVVVPVGDGLLGEVAGGHDERASGRGEEQVVERGVGEEQPHGGGVGGDLRRKRRTLPAAHQHHRPLRGGEERTLGAGEVAPPGRPRPGRAPSRRAASPPAAFVPGASAPRPARWRRRPGDTRRCPSPRG